MRVDVIHFLYWSLETTELKKERENNKLSQLFFSFVCVVVVIVVMVTFTFNLLLAAFRLLVLALSLLLLFATER